MRMLLLLLVGCGSAAPVSQAPDFELQGVRGASLWSEKPVVLVFMTAW